MYIEALDNSKNTESSVCYINLRLNEFDIERTEIEFDSNTRIMNLTLPKKFDTSYGYGETFDTKYSYDPYQHFFLSYIIGKVDGEITYE